MSTILRGAVSLCSEPAPALWGKDALISVDGQHIRIHRNPSEDPLRTIQRAGRRLETMGLGPLTLVGAEWTDEERFAFSQGYFSAKPRQALDFGAEASSALLTLIRLTHWVRQITNAPPAEVFPEVLAARAHEVVASVTDRVTAKVIRGDGLLAAGCVGLWAVGQGSAQAPVLLELDYNPTGDDNAPVCAALVGKGITFDSGGYSLKPSEAMLPMKSDMGGAAMVTAGLALAIDRGLDQRVKLWLCCAENMVSGAALKLGDILHYPNGVSVEVQNTDAEGRLVLADGLLQATASGAPFILDAATLTGAAKMAVGRDYNAILGLDTALVQRTLGFAALEQELAWPLPLAPWHQAQIGSAFADIANVGTQEGTAGASTAAAFLARFVPQGGTGWIHMDLSACYQKAGNELWATGAKGHGLRTIAHWLLACAAAGEPTK